MSGSDTSQPLELHYILAQGAADPTGRTDLLLHPDPAVAQAPVIKIGDMRGDDVVLLSAPAAVQAPAQIALIDPEAGYSLNFSNAAGASVDDPAGAILALLETGIRDVLGWDPEAVVLDEEAAEDGDLGFIICGGQS
jgi:hypothetical protein